MSTDDHTPTYSLPYDPLTRELGVLVGFDGSEHSFEALDFAAQAATGMGTRLTVVTAYTVPAMVYPNMASMPPVPDDVARRAAAQEVLDEAAAHLKNHDGPLDLRAEEGDAAGVMVHLSAQARLAVVGARGRGGFLGRPPMRTAPPWCCPAPVPVTATPLPGWCSGSTPPRSTMSPPWPGP